MATKVMLSVQRCQHLIKRSSHAVFWDHFYKLKEVPANIAPRRCASWFVSDKGIQEAPDESKEMQDDTCGTEFEDEAAIEAKRDVARLPEKMRNYLEHSLKMPERNLEYQFKPFTEKRYYAYFGRASGLDVQVAWPTKQELAETKEYEKDWEPTLQECWAQLNQEKEEEMEKRRLHEEKVEKAMAKMPEYIEQFKKRLAKEELVNQQQEEKRKKMMEEARDYFGYDIDPRDPRFKEMQERKAEEELHLKRKRRKEEKELKMEAALERLKSESKGLKKVQRSS